MACPPSKVINLYNLDLQESKTVDLAKEFDIDSVVFHYVHIPASSQFKSTVDQQTVHFVFVVKGSGNLKVGLEHGALKEWDCFGFPSLADAKEYEIVAGTEGVVVLQIRDNEGSQIPVTVKPPGNLPTIVQAATLRKPAAKGLDFCNMAQLTRLCDISANPKQANRWNATIEWVPPGTRTSQAHAHSFEDELAFMLQGKARYWHHGEEPEPILKPGDCTGWKAGTGIAHTLINDGDGPNGEGEWFMYLIWGLENGDIDQCFYPDRSDGKQSEDHKWKGHPVVPWGKASKAPKYPKPDDYTG